MEKNECPGCRQRDIRIAQLERRVAELEALVRDLLARLKTNASNSSIPPSANPLNAPPPVVKKRSRKKRGGQPGHPPHLKKLVPPERVKEVISFLPKQCDRCQAKLAENPSADDPDPVRHQVAEIPLLVAEIREYQGHARTCSCCGHITRASIPQEIRKHSCGPRLTATLVYLTGAHHLSRRAVEEISEDVFAAPVALGTLSAMEKEVSRVLEPAHKEALESVRFAEVKNVDETGWKLAGRKCWLWLAATETVALFVVHARRNLDGLTDLLSDTFYGILCTDRWPVYKCWPISGRQICWAHLKRDFQKLVDRGGKGSDIGSRGLGIIKRVFRGWYKYRGGGLTREELEKRMSPVTREFRKLLEEGSNCAERNVEAFCLNLRAIEPALWKFVETEGVEPTNNHAERMLRRGVLWRKKSFGSNSEGGCRFAERILTVVQTLRLQHRNILQYLIDSVHNYRVNASIPSLILKNG
jgi:transposase